MTAGQQQRLLLLPSGGGEQPRQQRQRRLVEVDLAGLVLDRDDDARGAVLPNLRRAVEDAAPRRAPRQEPRQAELRSGLGRLARADRRHLVAGDGHLACAS